MVGPPRALIFDRNRTVARRLFRVLVSAGFQAEIAPDEAAVARVDMATGLWLLVSEAAGVAPILKLLQSPPEGSQRCGVFYGNADELDFPALLAEPRVLGALGARPSSGTALPRPDLESELLGLARHLRGAALPPMQAQLLWGAQAFSTTIANLAGREAAVARVVSLCSEGLSASRRVADSAGEVVHELITNAMYDAPVDSGGQPRYAHDRTAHVELSLEDRVTFRYGTDGLRLGLEVADRFGRLTRQHLLDSLRRAASGSVSFERGGAGIGLSMIYRASQSLLVDVEPGVRTRMTAILDLDPTRQTEPGPRPGRSLIFPVWPVWPAWPAVGPGQPGRTGAAAP